MFFTLRELLRWLGVTVFELLVALVCFGVFSVLLVFKVEGDEFSGAVAAALTQTSWWWIFSPLFVSDAVNAYFCVIVFIRMHIEVTYDYDRFNV